MILTAFTHHQSQTISEYILGGASLKPIDLASGFLHWQTPRRNQLSLWSSEGGCVYNLVAKWGWYQPEGLSKSNDLLALSLLPPVLWTPHTFRLVPAHSGSDQRCLTDTYTPAISATIKSPRFPSRPTFNWSITTANATREVLSIFPVHLQAVLSPEFIHSFNISPILCASVTELA